VVAYGLTQVIALRVAAWSWRTGLLPSWHQGFGNLPFSWWPSSSIRSPANTQRLLWQEVRRGLCVQGKANAGQRRVQSGGQAPLFDRKGSRGMRQRQPVRSIRWMKQSARRALGRNREDCNLAKEKGDIEASEGAISLEQENALVCRPRDDRPSERGGGALLTTKQDLRGRRLHKLRIGGAGCNKRPHLPRPARRKPPRSRRRIPQDSWRRRD
jgi:hypothetical protein